MQKTEVNKTFRKYIRDKFITEERFLPKQNRQNLYTTAFILIAAGVVLFTALIIQVVNGVGIVSLDHQVGGWLVHIRAPFLTSLTTIFAIIFGPVALPVIVFSITILWLIFAKHAWRPLLLAGFMGLGVLLIQVITRLVQRQRPPVDLMLFGKDTTFSFPSGHVSGTADFFLLLGYLIVSRNPTPARVTIAASLAFIGISSQIFSRLYLGYHWLSDTLGSVCLALIIIGLVILIDTRRTVRIPGEKITGKHSKPQTDST